MLPHPIAENRLQNKQVSSSGALIAIENPNDQIHKQIHETKNIRFNFSLGFLEIT
jgi:hypothetical protein